MSKSRRGIVISAVTLIVAIALSLIVVEIFRKMKQMNFPDPDTVPRDQWGRRIPFIDESVSGTLLFLDRDRDFVVARLDSGVKESEFEPANELKMRKWKADDKYIVCYWFPSSREYVVGCIDEANAPRAAALQAKILEYSLKNK